MFTKSNDFCASKHFSNTGHLMTTDQFPFIIRNFVIPDQFGKTVYSTKTSEFSDSKPFPHSNKYSDSSLLLLSKHINNTDHYTTTDQFGETGYFTKTKELR